MLYNPPAFKVDDLGRLHDQIAATGLAMLVTVGPDGPLISHVPLYLDRDAGPFGALVGHLAKANPQLRQSNLDAPAVVVFQGPDAYVSPNWYPSKREHGKVVPTWNYAVVHARGMLSLFDDRDRLRAAVDRLTSRHEQRFAKPWATDDAPPDYMEAQLKGIVGIELAITAIEGKHKLSQNRTTADQAGVIDGLAASTDPAETATGALMRDGLLARSR